MKIIIVDENDNEIGVKERSEVEQKDIYRVSSLWVTNSKGEILLARRAYDKAHDPGKWGPAVAGTVEEGETYEDNIIKESEEELGLENLNIFKLRKIFNDAEHRFFSQRFGAIVDKDISEFKIRKEEVAEIKWFTKEELLEDFSENPEEYVPSFYKTIKLLDETP